MIQSTLQTTFPLLLTIKSLAAHVHFDAQSSLQVLSPINDLLQGYHHIAQGSF